MVTETTTPSLEAVANEHTSSTETCGYISNNCTYNPTGESNIESDDLSNESKSNLQQNDYQSVDATSSLLSPSVNLDTTPKSIRSDYENLSQFNNLNDDENYKSSFIEQINDKNIEVESISSPSSAILSEENNNTSKVILDSLESSKISTVDKNDVVIQVEKEANEKNIEETQSVDVEKCQNSQANSKFCLINSEDAQKREKSMFTSKTANAFLKEKQEKSMNKSFLNPKPATINKLLFIVCIFSICLFTASICYIVIAHLTNGFSFTYGLAGLFKNEQFIVPSITLGNEASSVDQQAIVANVSSFGKTINGEEVKKYVLKNQNGFEVSLISFGASIQSIVTKDKTDKSVNVIVGLNNINEYENTSCNPYLGCIVGRTSNRISNSEFTLDGFKYKLEANNGANSLHGGLNGFDKRNWRSVLENDCVKFSLSSHDGEGGYPGDVEVEVTYRIDKTDHKLYIDYKGVTNKATPIDMTNHAYFNLNGHDSGLQIYNHEVKIFADNYLVSTPGDLIPTGELKSVENTKYDFRNYAQLSDRIQQRGEWPEEGYDNFFIINQQSGRKHAASVRNRLNGLVLDVYSDQNGIQLYTGNFLNITVPSNGLEYVIHSALCMESQNFPDAVNQKFFPSSVVRPEGEYSQKTIWSFRIEN